MITFAFCVCLGLAAVAAVLIALARHPPMPTWEWFVLDMEQRDKPAFARPIPSDRASKRIRAQVAVNIAPDVERRFTLPMTAVEGGSDD